MSKIDNFPYPTSILAKIWRWSVWSRSVVLGSAEAWEPVHKIVIREIILEEFQRMWSQSTNVTDGRTDGQTTYHGNTELWYASCSKNAKITVLVITQFQLHTVGAESMGAMGAIVPTVKKLWGRCPQVVPTGILRHFWNSKMYIKNMNLFIIMPVTKVAQILA